MSSSTMLWQQWQQQSISRTDNTGDEFSRLCSVSNCSIICNAAWPWQHQCTASRTAAVDGHCAHVTRQAAVLRQQVQQQVRAVCN